MLEIQLSNCQYAPSVRIYPFLWP